jgi:hypothetical protein
LKTFSGQKAPGIAEDILSPAVLLKTAIAVKNSNDKIIGVDAISLNRIY